MKLFFVHGYAGCTFRQLVATAGLSKGAFYHYFSSKEQIYEAVLQARVAAYVAELQQSIAAHLPQFGLRDRVSETLVATIVHAVIEGVGVLCAFEQSTRPSARFQTIIGGLAEAIAPAARNDNALQ